MVFLQGLTSEGGPAAACLELFDDYTIELFVSKEVMAEIHDVLTRPKLRARFSRLTDERADKLIVGLKEHATMIEFVPRRYRYERDHKDEKYLNLAIAAGAEYLVSRDNDLLSLAEDNVVGRDFLSHFPNLRIVDLVIFLREARRTLEVPLG
jgi:putative PIN family toxin of toxin-antitoxin system